MNGAKPMLHPAGLSCPFQAQKKAAGQPGKDEVTSFPELPRTDATLPDRYHRPLQISSRLVMSLVQIRYGILVFLVQRVNGMPVYIIGLLALSQFNALMRAGLSAQKPLGSINDPTVLFPGGW